MNFKYFGGTMKANKKEWYEPLLISLIISLLFFSADFSVEYSTDTYATAVSGFRYTAVGIYAVNGRLITALGNYLWSITGLGIEEFYYFSYFLGLLCLIASLYIYQSLLKAIIENLYVRIICSFLIIANPFISEYYMFIENGFYLLAILSCVTATYFYVKGLEKKKNIYFFYSFLFVLVSAFTYQAIPGLFPILCIPFIYTSSKNFKQYFGDIIRTIIIYGISGLANVIYVSMISKSTRVSEKFGVFTLIRNMVNAIKDTGKWMWDSFAILPRGLYLSLFIALVCIIILIIFSKNYYGNRLKMIIHLMMSIIVINIMGVATIILGSGWFAPRVVYSLGCGVGIMCVLLYTSFNDYNKSKGFFFSKIWILYLIIGTYLCIQLFSFQKIFSDKRKLAALDRYRCQYVAETIHEYEDETGITVKNIAYYNEDGNNWCVQYDELFAGGDFVVSSFQTDWSIISAINYYNGTDYKKVAPIPKYQKYFSDKDWDVLSKEQFIFEGDTLHMAVYNIH